MFLIRSNVGPMLDLRPHAYSYCSPGAAESQNLQFHCFELDMHSVVWSRFSFTSKFGIDGERRRHEEIMSFSSRRRNYMLKRHRRDLLFEWMRDMLNHSFVLDAMKESAHNTWKHFEDLIQEYRRNPVGSRLNQMVPSVGSFFTPLYLARAWSAYDARYRVSARRFVNISFNEIRHICNLAQLLAFQETGDTSVEGGGSAEEVVLECGTEGKAEEPRNSLKLLTFDGDCTLYSDGGCLKLKTLADSITDLLKKGTHVALVTAAGYEYESARYEVRVRLLLDTIARRPDVTPEVARRFLVLGGECNYLLRCELSEEGPQDAAPQDVAGSPPRPRSSARQAHLVPIKSWNPKELAACSEDDISTLLDTAEKALRDSVEELNLAAVVIRKKRAVGIIEEPRRLDITMGPGTRDRTSFRREALDEVVLRVQAALNSLNSTIPFCAFNGGNDVFVDIGNKRVGVVGLQEFLRVCPRQCLHVGDQFLNTGNDHAARSCCPTVWVTQPSETVYVVRQLLDPGSTY